MWAAGGYIYTSFCINRRYWIVVFREVNEEFYIRRRM